MQVLPSLTDEQQTVMDAAMTFIEDDNPSRPYFLYEALAGSGKTVILSTMARRLPRATLCAFTGKAASVLTRKSGIQASTVHSAIYDFMGVDPDTDDLVFSRKIEDNRWRRRVALLDESGTVDRRLAEDLLATGCRVVACGDPGQLRPVKGERFFRDPDATLTTVHRQALDSPIIRQAHAVQGNEGYRADGDAFRVASFVGREDILRADVILCWRNGTRRSLNDLARAHRGLHGQPVAGEPVMCLRNEHELGVLNGATYVLPRDRRADGVLEVVNERGEAIGVDAAVEGLDPVDVNDRDVVPFAFAYASTVHKFQGSEAASVVLYDEYGRHEERREWLYTGITRAAERITVVRH